MKRKARSRAGAVCATLLALGMVVGIQAPPVASQPLGKTGYERHQELLWIDNDLNERGLLTGRDPYGASISANGRWVAFTTDVPMVAEDINELTDIYIKDTKTGRIELASRTFTGVSAIGPPSTAQHDGHSGLLLSRQPSISANGRFVAFSSSAVNLVPGDTNLMEDAFVYDRRAKVVERVSVNSAGEEQTHIIAQSGGRLPSISATGRRVAFESPAPNLVDDDTNDANDIFVHDRKSRTTVRASVASDGNESDQPSARHSLYPSISGNGRYVAFRGPQDLDDDEGPSDGIPTNHVIYVHDLSTGHTERVSVASDGTPGEGNAGRTAISHDGRYVTFSSTDSHLVPNDTNRRVEGTTDGTDIFVHDRRTGRTERVSVEPDGRQVGPRAFGMDSRRPSLSPDGRYVTFEIIQGTRKPGDQDGYYEAYPGPFPFHQPMLEKGPFVYDRETGEVDALFVKQFESPHHPEANFGSDVLGYASLSRGGRYLAIAHGAAEPRCQSLSSSGTLVTRVCQVTFWADRGDPVGTIPPAPDNPPPDGGDEGDEELCIGDICVPDPFPQSAGATVNAGSGFSRRGEKLVGATMALRPTFEDLYVKIEVDRIPGPRGGIAGLPAAGDPAIVYGARFTVGGTVYEVRVARLGVLGEPGQALFGLFRCAPTCTEVTRLTGGYGTVGESVVTAIPLRHFDVDGAKADVSAHSAYSALGTYVSGPSKILDRLAFAR